MAATTLKLYAVEDALTTEKNPNENQHNVEAAKLGSQNSRYYVRFEEITESTRRRHVSNVQIYGYITEAETGSLASIILLSSFQHDNKETNLSEVTYSNPKGLDEGIYHTFYMSPDSALKQYAPMTEARSNDAMIKTAVTGTTAIGIGSVEEVSLEIQGFGGANRPYLLLSLEDPEITPKPTPVSGDFIDRAKDNTFRWEIVTNAYGGAAAFEQASAVISWRDGEDGTVNTLNVSEAATSHIIPAGTFPQSANLQWMVSVVFVTGEAAESEWTPFTTIDGISTCAAVQPVNTYVDGRADTRFAWQHTTATGSPQTASDLQYSTDGGNTWLSVASAVETADEYYDVPAGTLPAGTVLWRVRTYNANGLPGEWSAPVTIIVQAAPRAPYIESVTATPRPVIVWRSGEQQAYQVQVGGHDSGQTYGVEKQYKVPEFLPDGEAAIRVRVQNSFGLWSDWAAVTVTIANVPPQEIRLAAAPDDDRAVLTWNTGPAAEYYVYRDGVPIARVTGGAYTDELTTGHHAYMVRGVAEDDNYALSNTVRHETVMKRAVIGILPGPEWLPLKCRRGGRPTHNISVQPVVAYHHYAGRALPVADISPFRTVTDDFSFTVLDEESRRRLAAMVGNLVMYKDAQGVVVGVLDRASVDVRRKSDIDFSISRVDWSDRIEYTV